MKLFTKTIQHTGEKYEVQVIDDTSKQYNERWGIDDDRAKILVNKLIDSLTKMKSDVETIEAISKEVKHPNEFAFAMVMHKAIMEKVNNPLASILEGFLKH